MDQRERLELAASVFLAASRAPAGQAGEIIEQRCAGDAELRGLVERMMRMRDEPGDLAPPARGQTPPEERSRQNVADAPTITGQEGVGVWVPPDEHEGDQIGRYRLLELIGEGGFGRVWVAEQREPVQRRVALKIIKAGMDTRQVVARFEQERQALALMDHPNIAKVFDAGATDRGRPFFVMELCKGQDVAAYCDRNTLSIRDRLEVFAQICSAVQHAHTKGIIHRDIKPGNVLVSTHDARPVAKVIDFGIAKAIDARLTEKTLFTQHRQMIGTPEYMSPEQADGSLDIDTRTDVYSLGVLLYELLTGTTPFGSQDLGSAAYAEIQRIIREVDPPRPSTRLIQSTDTREQIARQRRTDPGRLGTALRGELDWIVMKAMEKARARRYDTAGALGEDIRRFLDGRAVVAAPPSTAYRVSKFVSRHRAAALGVAAVALTLVLGVVGTSIGLARALDEKARADFEADQAIAAAESESLARAQADLAAARAIEAERQTAERAAQLERVAAFQAEMLGQVDATDAGATLQRRILERFGTALEREGVDEADRAARTEAFSLELARVNATDTAADMIDSVLLSPSVAAIDSRFADQPLVDASLRATLSTQYESLGLVDAALALGQEALETRRRELGPEHPDTLASELDVATLLGDLGRHDDAEPMFVHVFEARARTLGEDDRATLRAWVALGDHYRASGQLVQAERMLRDVLERNRAVLGNSDRGTLASLNILGNLLVRSGRYGDALPLWQEAYDTGLATYGPDDRDVLVWMSNLGALHRNMANFEAAGALLQRAMEGFRRIKGEDHPLTLDATSVYATLLEDQTNFEAADPIFADMLARCVRTLGPEHPLTIRAKLHVGRTLARRGRLAEAETYYRPAYESRLRNLGRGSAETIVAQTLLANLVWALGRAEEAESLYLSGIEAARASLGSEHSDTQTMVYQYGTMLLRMGRFAEAEPYVRESAETTRRVSGENALDTLRRFTNLARVYEQLGDIERAEAMYRDVAGKFQDQLGPDSPDTIIAWANIAGLMIRNGRKPEAVPLIEDAVDRFARVYGPDNSTLGIMRNMHGTALAAAGRFAEAEAALLESNRIYSTAQGVPDRTKQANYRDLVALYEAWEAAEPGRGHAEKAEPWRALLPPA